MFCDNCGEKLEEGSVFCPNCGAHIEEDLPEKTDPQIEEEIPKKPEPEISAERESAPASDPVAKPSAPAEPATNKNGILVILGIGIVALLLILIVVVIVFGVRLLKEKGKLSPDSNSTESTSEGFSSTEDNPDYANLHNAASVTVDGELRENLPAYFMPDRFEDRFLIAFSDPNAGIGAELQINQADLFDGVTYDLEDCKSEEKGALCFVQGLGSTGVENVTWMYTGDPQGRTGTCNDAFRAVDFKCVSYDPDGDSVFVFHIELEDPETGEEHILDGTIVAPFTPEYVDWTYGLV